MFARSFLDVGNSGLALSETQTQLLEMFEADGPDASIELTTFNNNNLQLQLVLSDLHYRNVMKPRGVLRSTAAWQFLPHRYRHKHGEIKKQLQQQTRCALMLIIVVTL